MKRGKDIAATFPGLYLVHQNIPGKSVEIHSHKEAILFIPLQGEIKVKLEGKELVCGPGKMIYLPSNTRHAFDSSSMLGERLIALLSPVEWKKSKGGTHAPKVLPTLQLCKELFFYLLLNPKSKHSKAIISTAFQTLDEALSAQGNFADIEQLSSKITDPRVRVAFDSIEKDFFTPLSMDEVAKAAGLSVRNLNRLFLTEIGITPKNVQALFRMRRAEELLSSGTHSVTDTAFEVGYESLSQFIDIFRRITGRLPSSYLPS